MLHKTLPIREQRFLPLSISALEHFLVETKPLPIIVKPLQLSNIASIEGFQPTAVITGALSVLEYSTLQSTLRTFQRDEDFVKAFLANIVLSSTKPLPDSLN